MTAMLIDKVGRKPLLWIGSAGMADSMGVLALVAANVHVVFFNMSWAR